MKDWHPMMLLKLWWQGRPLRERNAMTTGLVVLAVVALIWAWVWLREERVRLRGNLAIAEAQLKEMQNDLAELQRLRAETVPSQLSLQALVQPLANSLLARKLALSVTALDADRLRVQGTAGFDETISWLGTIQRDHRLRIVTLAATRQASNVKLDAVLGSTGS
jgi:type II secretory pathway component PulM